MKQVTEAILIIEKVGQSVVLQVVKFLQEGSEYANILPATAFVRFKHVYDRFVNVELNGATNLSRGLTGT